MSEQPSIPAGWYPDPSGAPQWRVWNGRAWSNVTRPFPGLSAAVPVDAVRQHLEGRALRRVWRAGTPSYFAGYALLLSALAHWPGTAHPTSPLFAFVSLDVALTLLAVGAVTYAAALRELQGRWTLDAVVPGLNVLSLMLVVSERLGVKARHRQMVLEALLLLLAGFFSHADAVCFIALWVVCENDLGRTRAALDDLEASNP